MQSLDRLKSTRPRRKNDFYETPIELCIAALCRLRDDYYDNTKPINILDPGAGGGVWGKAANKIFPGIYVAGVEIENKEEPPEYEYWLNEDYLHMDYMWQHGLIIGNPPYSLAEEFIRHSFTCLKDGGHILFLLRLAFLESKKRHFGLFTDHPLKQVYVLSRRPSFFSVDGKRKTTDALSYAMFLWQKGWDGDTKLGWLYWRYHD